MTNGPGPVQWPRIADPRRILVGTDASPLATIQSRSGSTPAAARAPAVVGAGGAAGAAAATGVEMTSHTVATIKTVADRVARRAD